MKLCLLLFFFFIFLERIFSEEPTSVPTSEKVPEETEYDVPQRNFEKDMEELDLSGYEDDIENIEELAYEEDGSYITQIYVYIRIDDEYKDFMKHMHLIKLGERYMTLLQSAMIDTQLKITGVGMFTCYYSKKSQTDDLVTYFLLQKEVDFLEVGFDQKFPEGRSSPITSVQERKKLRDSSKNEEL